MGYQMTVQRNTALIICAVSLTSNKALGYNCQRSNDGGYKSIGLEMQICRGMVRASGIHIDQLCLTNGDCLVSDRYNRFSDTITEPVVTIYLEF